MNIKKIWSLSIVFGLMAATVAYFAIFSDDKSTKASSEQKVEAAETKENSTDKEEKVGREFTNPILEITKGKRAISLTAALAEGGSGYIQPDSKVDVIAFETTKDESTKKEYKSAVLVLENVKVLASGKSSNTSEEALLYETVTLEVTPEEGVMLSLAAKDKDGFYFMLRNAKDSATGKIHYKQTRELINMEGAQ